eukprot:TRINITY_DN751_c0_g1_i5.p1 TRINITY_DN751_c0_g1~~TRINITY_DN751_c0_g1_i5.p1  ORF type:complete len:126 (-),score=11.61 TRINITY_DN751_c0_g1_i5:57-434(-)
MISSSGVNGKKQSCAVGTRSSNSNLTGTLVHAALVECGLFLLKLLNLGTACGFNAVVVVALHTLLRGTLEDLHVKRVLVLRLRVVRSAVGNLVTGAVRAVVVLEGLAVGAHDTISDTGHFYSFFF